VVSAERVWAIVLLLGVLSVLALAGRGGPATAPGRTQAAPASSDDRPLLMPER
jgi:hypothetical protein